MRASVVVLNFNSGEQIERCIADLLAQVDVADYEVVLVDNASTDGSCEQVERRHGEDPRLRIHRAERNLGCAGGRNRGLDLARGEVISFVDSDSFADPGWLRAVLAAAESPGVGLVACRLIYARNRRVLNGLGGVMNYQGYAWDLAFGEPVDLSPLPQRAFYACGNGLTTKREVVARLGGFDDAYLNYYEDVEFCLRARRAGYELALAPDAVLEHWMGGADAIHRNKLFLCERNRIRTVLKHYPPRWLWRWLAQELRFESSGDHLVDRRLRARAWLWNLAGLPSVLRFRWGRGRRLPPLDVERLLEPYWGYGRHRGYNLGLQPDLECLTSRIVIGESGESALLFGWHAAESSGGSRYRWSDGLAACALSVGGTMRRLQVEFCWPDAKSAAAGADIYVVCPHAGTVTTAALPAGVPFEWQAIEVELGETSGAIELILQTRAPLVSASPFSQRLVGVGVRAIELR